MLRRRWAVVHGEAETAEVASAADLSAVVPVHNLSIVVPAILSVVVPAKAGTQ
jgi:hypothetical protein